MPARLVCGRTRPRRGNRRDRANGRNRDERAVAATPNSQRHLAAAGVGRCARAVHAAARLPLGGAIRETLYRNYVSIEAAQHMHAALTTLQVAERDGRAKDVLPGGAAKFHALDRRRESRLHRSWRARTRRRYRAGAATSCSPSIAAAPPGSAPRSRIRRVERPPRRSDRDEQGRDVPRGQPLGKAGPAPRVRIRRRACAGAAGRAPRSRGVSDGGCHSR